MSDSWNVYFGLFGAVIFGRKEHVRGEGFEVYNLGTGKGTSVLPLYLIFRNEKWWIKASMISKVVRYLHNGKERCVVHRDIKPSNIILSSRKSPKVCDFGLTTWASAPSVPFLCKTIKGTFGYLAPEYQVSDKTDVYSFGVVLLELIT
ncbi:hypothetical protein CTI12_AA354030 [Artemisia annua]|uniref:Protein kinase domain-containing protein n=1 Tax=Artemisia annua TaxID=35608 RepID=A0A2U1MQ89_ARTAN|nr:hypothetical protein CTI12_AA354030 [Artemisia annua]